MKVEESDGQVNFIHRSVIGFLKAEKVMFDFSFNAWGSIFLIRSLIGFAKFRGPLHILSASRLAAELSSSHKEFEIPDTDLHVLVIEVSRLDKALCRTGDSALEAAYTSGLHTLKRLLSSHPFHLLYPWDISSFYRLQVDPDWSNEIECWTYLGFHRVLSCIETNGQNEPCETRLMDCAIAGF